MIRCRKSLRSVRNHRRLKVRRYPMHSGQKMQRWKKCLKQHPLVCMAQGFQRHGPCPQGCCQFRQSRLPALHPFPIRHGYMPAPHLRSQRKQGQVLSFAQTVFQVQVQVPTHLQNCHRNIPPLPFCVDRL